MRTDLEELRRQSRAEFTLLDALPPDDPRREAARDQLVALHLPLVRDLARRFGSSGEPVEDLLQVGTIGLIKAVDRFELDRGVEFSTYATPTIVGEIKRWFRDKGWTIRVPRRLQDLRMALAAATDELSQALGKAPTVTEIADHLQVSEDDVLEALESANAHSTLSLDAPGSAQLDGGSIGDLLGEADAALDAVELRESLRPVLETLPRRERTIVCLRFFRQLTQSQIAAEVGMSQMHVSRLLSRSLSALRAELDRDA
jgi:RNA polymerase sigma-B factor